MQTKTSPAAAFDLLINKGDKMPTKKKVEPKKEEPKDEVLKDEPKASDTVTSDPQASLPAPGGKVIQPTEVKVTKAEEKANLFFILYILFKGNLISRMNLKHMIQLTEEELPEEGLVKYLVNEAAKA